MEMDDGQLSPGGRVSMRTLMALLKPSLRSAMILIGCVPSRTNGALGTSMRILNGSSSMTETAIWSTHVR